MGACLVHVSAECMLAQKCARAIAKRSKNSNHKLIYKGTHHQILVQILKAQTLDTGLSTQMVDVLMVFGVCR